ncbi:hypothetical protein [Tuberibacillus sp. Marseille-P3662]|uniref:hypothetical protein n=1 Tax=Tuberibacillus sp. Marseille-P3662 TaxID=1965358 RepID=UPI000A1C867D|nr:hypothetical protein [Tuberibacillus sp. Marseille-P3662]
MSVEVKSKTRSDKKRDIKPTIAIQLYEAVSRLSYITDTPIKDVSVTICKRGLYAHPVLEYLSDYFRRDYWANNQTLYTGELENEKYQTKKGITKRRITMRFTQRDYDQLARLAYALDLTISSATGLLLELALKNTDVFHSLVAMHINKELDPGRMKQLREIIKYINRHNPYETISFGHVVTMIMEDIKDHTVTMTESVKQWIDEHTSK